jgi:hypothetical protein
MPMPPRFERLLQLEQSIPLKLVGSSLPLLEPFGV